MAVNPIPEGFHSITPFLYVKNTESLIEFLKKAFDAQEKDVSRMPDGTIMHAEIIIGNSIVMMGEASDNRPDMPEMPAMLYLYVEDVDAVYKKAISAGGVSLREPTNEFYGDRSSGIKDPSGNQWWIATHVEDVSAEEIDRRMQEMMQKSTTGT